MINYIFLVLFEYKTSKYGKLVKLIFELTRLFEHEVLLLFEEEFYLFKISRI